MAVRYIPTIIPFTYILLFFPTSTKNVKLFMFD